jgi:hypothetical protein
MLNFFLQTQRVLLAHQPEPTTTNITAAPRVTWHDQQQQPPSPQQRVQFELLPDDTTIAQPTVPTITIQSQQQSAPLLPPPWTPFDIASVRGTAITATRGSKHTRH